MADELPISGDDPPLPTGTLVGEYRVERPIGHGTFGDVYAGEHPVIGKRVAIKVLRRAVSESPEGVARFVAEARAVNRARHPNIVDVFSFGTFGEGRHYYVMELLEGETLGDLLDREHKLSPARALPILRGIADALDAAHAAGIVHRDLKPDNVFLVSDGRGGQSPKLLDFGVSKLVGEPMGIKTATGVAIGTPRYMSPEQARGRKVDRRSDVYALGVLTHEVLTGRPPFEAKGAVELLLQHTVEPPPRVSSHGPELGPDLDAPVLAMLEKKPGDRPPSAGAAIQALAARLAGGAGARTMPLGTRLGDAPTVRAAPRLPAAPQTVLLDPPPPAPKPLAGETPTLDARPRERTPVSSNTAFAPTLASSPAPTPADLPRSGLPWTLAVIGALLAALSLAGVLAFRGKAPTPTIPLSSVPAPSPVPVPSPVLSSVPVPAPVPAPVLSPSPSPQSPPPTTTLDPAPTAPPRPLPKATSSPKKGSRDIGF